MKNVTIKEVAAHAGMSITTVSRALNNNYPVSAEAREKIERAVSEPVSYTHLDVYKRQA